MIEVTEFRSTRGSGYQITEEDGTERIVQTTHSRQKVKGIDTFVLRSSSMAILMKPSCFLTDELRYEARNTVAQATSAMKAVENFSSIIGTPFEAYGIDAARAFMQFLRGTLSEGITYRFDLMTQRSEGTVSAYLKHIRRYARWLGVGNSPFLQGKRALSSTYPMSSNLPEGHRLRANVVESKEAPRYISVDEYRSILSEIDSSWTIEERCIVRLMFEHGLRIGEVLGLTVEDLNWTTGKDGTAQYSVTIRNRASDRDDQHAKTLMRVTDAAQYKSSDYKRRNVGFQSVYLSGNLFFQIMDYAESMLPEEIAPDCPCLADNVKSEEPNRYLFVNTKGRPLSANLWNKRLRRIMEDAGVHVDRDVRRTNLNHRFRHGYAMFLTHEARESGRILDDFAVMTLMRHKSITSTEVYQKPTTQDVKRMQDSIVGSFEEEIYGTDIE